MIDSTTGLSAEAELILKDIEESIKKVCKEYLDKSSKTVPLGFTAPTAIPFRKNKRKRIQKKWNKKYGFKLKTVRMDGMKMKAKTDGDVCEFEAVQEI